MHRILKLVVMLPFLFCMAASRAEDNIIEAQVVYSAGSNMWGPLEQIVKYWCDRYIKNGSDQGYNWSCEFVPVQTKGEYNYQIIGHTMDPKKKVGDWEPYLDTIYRYYRCPAGYSSYLKVTQCIKNPPDYNIKVTADAPIIADKSRVDKQGKVLTQATLHISLTDDNDGKAVANMPVDLVSDRGSVIDILDPIKLMTDASGAGVAKIETRDQSDYSTVIASHANSQPAYSYLDQVQINWLPSEYEIKFQITCYVTSLESDWPNVLVPETPVGLIEGKTYRVGFIADTKMQGSGVTLDGTHIQYDSGKKKFYIPPKKCALTSTGKCAVEGSIAVDNHIIPANSSVNVKLLGDRKVWDVGGGIIGYHIDDYMGFNRSKCEKVGNKQKTTIQILHY